MALTYRSAKGSALTTDELDNNFRHFTGSHTVTGDLTVSGNVTGSFVGDGTGLTGVTGEWDGTHVGDAQITGSLTLSGSLLPNTAFNHDLGSIGKPWRELFISTGSIKFVSTLGANPSTASFNIQPNSVGQLSLKGVYTGSFEGKFKGNGDLITSLKGANTLIVTGSNASSILSGTTTMGGDPSAAQPGEGATTIAGGTLTVTSTNSTINSTNITINSNTSISGSTTVSGSVNITGSTVINGGTTVSGSINITGSTVINGGTIINGGTTVSGSVNITGSTVINGGTTVSGSINITGSTVINGGTTVSGSINITGSTVINGGTIINGGTTVSGSVNITGSTTITGPITLGSTCSDSITINGTITSSCDISSSGIIQASQFEVDNKVALNTNGSNTGKVFGDSDIIRVEIGRTGQINRNISLLGPVTASTTISASGNITAPTATLTNLSGGGTKFVTIDDDGVLKNSDGINVNISGSTTITGSLTISGSGTLTNIGPFNQTGTSTFTGNLTSSGDLSCQNITASSYSFSSISRAAAIDASHYAINGSRGEIRSQLQGGVAADTGWTVTLANTSIAADSLIVANVIGGFGSIITGSVVSANVISANSASFNFFNTGVAIPDDSVFTASFAIF